MTATTERTTTTARLFAVPAPVRLTYRLLDRAAPAISARWAEGVWMTLPKPRRTIQPIETGTPFPAPVAGRVWGDGPPVYLVHGWAGYQEQFAAFIPALVAAGHRVVAFDMPSHGRSAPGRFGPRSSSIPEFADTLAAVVATHGNPYAIVAHSMGAIATAVALRDGLSADRLVLLAPMAHPAFLADQLGAVLGFGERTHRRVIARIERRVGAPMSHFDVPAIGRTGTMPPTLLMHDRDDRSTPVDNASAIADAWPGAHLHVTTGLGHTRLLRDPDVVARAVAFVTTP
jgi:pimeloyl-ACP methyl ester carboxylesterase